jgi:hypothetical protein
MQEHYKSTNEWRNKIHAALRKNDILINTIPWINYKKIMLSEISQSQKTTTYYDSIFMKCPK